MSRTPQAVLALYMTAVLAAGCDGGPTETALPLRAEAPSHDLAPSSGVRFTELHYDNAGTDTGEAIEITGPAGTDLTGWSVVLYNGSTSEAYDTRGLSGSLPATCGSEGVLVLDYPSNGIQNGSPDGLALVDATGTVVEFLSYEGQFTAVGGPADGLTGTDIGVAEGSSTEIGQSLQRLDDAWRPAAVSSFGECNAGQGGGGGGGAAAYLSELHYDNTGTDANEAFEVAGPAGTDLAGWSVVLYNGNGGVVYGTVPLSGVIPATCRPHGGLAFTHSGIQNGPDGLALVDAEGTVVEFFSYEATFDATDGPAAGMTSMDMGVAESSSTPDTESLQRDGADQDWYGPAASTFGCEAAGGGDNGDSPSGPLFLSEIRADQPDSDTDEYFEVGGAAGTTMGGVSLVVIGDGSGGDGVIENVTDIGAYTLSSEGAFVAAESSFSLGTADLTTSLNFENGGNPTYLLVVGFTGTNGQDLDTDDDGTLDAMPWTELLDCVSLIQYLGAQPTYCDARVGLDDQGFTTGHAVRTGDGWISGIFTPPSGDTPGTLTFDPATAVAGQIAPWNPGAHGEPTAVSLSASYVTLPVGYNRALYVTVFDDYHDAVDGATVTFTSSDAGVVTSDRYGNLTAEGVGTATLEAAVTGDPSVSTTVAVEVVPDVASGVAYQDHLEFGTPTDADPSDDILLQRDEYAVDYNPLRGAANWVSYDLDESHIGDVARCDCYTPDPALPASAPHVINFDYTGSGYSRGHLVQSFDRTVTLPDNASTYLTTNIIPQAAANNTGPWGDFEYYINGRAFAGEEVYVIAGGVWTPDAPTLKDEGKVAIPSWTWKVAVFLGRDETLADVHSLDDLEVTAIMTPNRLEPGVDGTVDGIKGDWESYRVEVDQIEAATGYDLLSLLPDELEAQIESGLDGLSAAFGGFVADGAIDLPAENALSQELEQALMQLERGRPELAAQRLDTFLNLLRVFERNGKITSEAAAALRAEVEHVLTAITT